MKRLLCLLATSGALSCGPPPHPPGKVKTLNLEVSFKALSAAQLSQIGSFSVEILGAGTRPSYSLTFDSQPPYQLEWVPGKEPKDLAVDASLAVRLRARSLTDEPLPFGGTGGPLELAQVPADGTVTLRVLLSELDKLSPLSVSLQRARFQHTSTLVRGSGLLVVGGAASGPPSTPTDFVSDAEWVDPFHGTACASAGAGSCRNWGTVPSPRIRHVSVNLADGFGPDCPKAGNVFVGLGQGESGALGDAYLFDPAKLDDPAGAFTKISLGLTARAGASAFATSDCRVVIVGGDDGSVLANPVPRLEVVSFKTASGNPEPSSTPGPSPTSGGALVRLANVSSDFLSVGGRKAGGEASSSAAVLTAGVGQLEVCDLQDPICNGAKAPLQCARPHPAAARLVHSSELAPTLVIGDDDTGSCGVNKAAELFRSGTAAPYYNFVSISGKPAKARWSGHSVTAVGDGAALLVGGFEAGQTSAIDVVERFSLGAGLTEAPGPVSGTFTVVQTAPIAARAFHSAVGDGAEVIVAGGWDGTQALSSVAVFVSDF